MIGKTLGKYRIQDRIGRGGMGTVYLAVDEILHRDVAIKVLNSELNDSEIAKRFKAEAVTVARLSHPGIATVYELFEHDSQWLMVMEFVRGETLEHLIERTGAVPIERASELITQALTALAHAHGMGVVHRDLKPANIMVTDGGTVKIMDFGIARVAGSEHLTTAGFMMGTPAYMAPEQVLGQEVDARTDLYAIGVVLYRLASGKLPFKGDTPFAMAQSQVNDHPTPLGISRAGLPPWIEQVIGRALSKRPEERFQTADEFRETIRRGVSGQPLEMTPNAFVPPELLLTALPGTLRVAGTPAAGLPMAAAPTGPTAMPAGTTGQTAVGKPKKSNTTLIAAVAALFVILAIGGGLWYRSRSAPAPEVPPPTPTVPDATTSADPNATGQPVATVPPPPAPSTTSAPGTGGAPATSGTTAPPPPTTAPATTNPGAATGAAAAGTGQPGVPPPAAGRGPATSAADAHVSFGDVKLVVVNENKKGQDQDVVINFVAGQISVAPKRGGAAIVMLPYTMLKHATYIKAKDPKWNPALESPPDGTEFPHGFMGGSRHWLVLQSKTSYVVMHLNDSNVTEILDTVETRTGVKVDRPAAGGK